MASSFLWWTWQNQSQVQQGSDEKDPSLVNFSPLVCFHQYFQFMIQKTLKSATLWQYNYDTNAEAATVCIPNMYETASLQKAGLRQCSVTCLWNRMLSLKGDYDRQNNEAVENRANGNHSFSSGFWGSKILTCVKGKSPLRPFTSPSHWPFMFILVTFTISPTCKNGERRQSQHVLCKQRKES